MQSEMNFAYENATFFNFSPTWHEVEFVLKNQWLQACTKVKKTLKNAL